MTANLSDFPETDAPTKRIVVRPNEMTITEHNRIGVSSIRYYFGKGEQKKGRVMPGG